MRLTRQSAFESVHGPREVVTAQRVMRHGDLEGGDPRNAFPVGTRATAAQVLE